jgi:nitrite reductase/ring-hydroxylating ferredoxin subunit/uncharacterized membrane protein
MPRRTSLLHHLAHRVGDASILDPPAKRVGRTVRGAFPPGAPRDALSGAWLGHSLHPVLTDAVIGTWSSALLLDVLGGERDGEAAQRLIALGLAAYAPTAAAGALDWADSEAVDDGIRRIGAVHALSNAVAAGLQAASLARRRRGDRGQGVALSLAGAAVLGLGGYLGGHLSFAHGVGVDQTAFDAGSADWAPALAAADAREGEAAVGDAAGTPVLVVRSAGRLRAIHDRCSHRGCSLAEGTLDGDVVECACHGSRFRLADGGIERGPASSPQPAFDIREREGRIEVRRRS